MESAIQIVFQLTILIFSVVIHEISHGFMALYLGDRTAQYAGRLTLNPIPHLSLWGMVIIPILSFLTWGVAVGGAKPVPYNPYNLRNQQWGPSLVAAAGPASNLIIALVFGMVLRLIDAFAPPSLFILNLYSVLTVIVWINVALAVVNLIPIPPIDGSKVIVPFLPAVVRQNLFFWWHQNRQFFSQYWFVFLLLFILFGRIILSAIFSVISPIISALFALFTGIYSPFY